MNPIDLIKADLKIDTSDPSLTERFLNLQPVDSLSPFSSSKTYIIRGRTEEFDFRSLPHGSYAVYVANGRKAQRLTAKGREIESLLAENWMELPDCDPVTLARLILKFETESCVSHSIFVSAQDFWEHYSKEQHISPSDACNIDEKEFNRIRDRLGTTTLSKQDSDIALRVVTLLGWMHEKQNLGIEHLRILPSGRILAESRVVLSDKIFKSIPNIMY